MSLAPNAFFAADYGTSLTIADGGTFELTGDADYHQGFLVPTEGLSVFTNNGTLVKSGTGASVVDADYVQGATGQVVVQSGTLRPSRRQPDLRPGGAGDDAAPPGPAAARPAAPAQPTTDRLVDADRASRLTVPGSDTRARRPCSSRSSPGQRVDRPERHRQRGPRARRRSGTCGAGRSHRPPLLAGRRDGDATGPGAGRAHPGRRQCQPGARLRRTGRCPPAHDCVRTAPGHQVSRQHVRVGVDGRPRAAGACGAARRPQQPIPAAASAPQGLTVKKAAPFDGSALAVAWSPPASSGTAPVTSYRVALDGQVVANAGRHLRRR